MADARQPETVTLPWDKVVVDEEWEWAMVTDAVLVVGDAASKAATFGKNPCLETKR